MQHPSGQWWERPESPYGAPGNQPEWYGSPGQPPRRPGTLLAAIVLTFIGSGILVLVGAAILVIVGTADDEAVRSFASGMGFGNRVTAVRAVGIGAGIGVLVQAGVLILGAVLAQLGRNAGRIILTVVAGINIVLNLVQLAGGQSQVLLVLVYVVITLVFLWVGGANDWFRWQRAARRLR